MTLRKKACLATAFIFCCSIAGKARSDGQDITPELVRDSMAGLTEPPAPTPAPGRPSSPLSIEQIATLSEVRKVSMGPKEKKGTAVTDGWDNAKGGIPAQGPDGRVVYTFGSTLPSVICARYCVCDIELEAGEVVRKDGVFVGDDVHFGVNLTVSGPDDNPTPHIIIKPKEEVGFETTMIVTTDRRTYYFRLGSTEKEYMARVAFTYPDATERQRKEFFAKQELQKESQRKKAAEKEASAPEKTAGTDKLDFSYSISGKAPWKPVRVYNDGLKTYIDMPELMRASEAPALVVLSDEGTEQQVNYRLQGNRYKVDYVIEKAILVAGVGSGQTRVIIEREQQ